MQRLSTNRVLGQARERLYHNGSSPSLSSSSVLHLLRYDPKRSQEQQQQRNVLQRAFPRVIRVTPGLQQQLRLFSAATTKEGADDRSNNTNSTYRERFRDRASDMRARASDMRNNAKESYKEFREHPRESMREGAKSFSGMMRKYGPVFIGTYASVYLTTLGLLFGCVQSGALDPIYLFSLFGQVDTGESQSIVDLVVEWMKNHSFTEKYASTVEEKPYLANFAVAWIAVKFTEPIRAAVAIGLTPRVARFIGHQKEEDDEETSEEEKDNTTATSDMPDEQEPTTKNTASAAATAPKSLSDKKA